MNKNPNINTVKPLDNRNPYFCLTLSRPASFMAPIVARWWILASPKFHKSLPKLKKNWHIKLPLFKGGYIKKNYTEFKN